MHFRRSAWLGRKAIPERQGSRDVEFSIRPMQGKAYYGSLVKVSEETPVTCNSAEVSKFEWLTVDQIRERLSANSTRKVELLKVLFDKMVHTEL